MKKFIFIALFLLSCLVFAQQENRNRFSEDEITSQSLEATQAREADVLADNGPGNPGGGDELPIDDYLPLLAVVALGFIAYTIKKKNKLVS